MSILKLFKVARKAKVVTRKYPFEKPLVTEDFRGKIIIDPTKCWGCGVCVRICPPNALSIKRRDDNTFDLEYFVGRCIFCGMCAEVCPTGAIEVTKEFELASITLEDLKSSVIHRVKICENCGAVIGPDAQVNRVNKGAPETEKYVSLCSKCRRLRVMGKIASKMGAQNE